MTKKINLTLGRESDKSKSLSLHSKIKTKFPTLNWNLRMYILNYGLNDNIINKNTLINNIDNFNKSNIKSSTKTINSLTNIQKVKRSSQIISGMVGSEFDIHNGLQYTRIKVTSEMVGYRFGEFVVTTAWSTIEKKKQKK